MARTGQTKIKAVKPGAAKKITTKASATKTARKSVTTLTGGCLCGEIRYRITPLAADIDFCHCTMCQRWSGAPVSAWAQVPASQFRLIKGTAAAFASSKIGIRYFCPTCGSSVYMTDESGADVGIMLGTLDEAEKLKPTAHGFWPEHLSWLKVADDLSRFAGEPPIGQSLNRGSSLKKSLGRTKR